MFTEEKAKGEPQEEWPEWYLLNHHPILATGLKWYSHGVFWYSYVVLPQK